MTSGILQLQPCAFGQGYGSQFHCGLLVPIYNTDQRGHIRGGSKRPPGVSGQKTGGAVAAWARYSTYNTISIYRKALQCGPYNSEHNAID